jgi:hypothetical protein
MLAQLLALYGRFLHNAQHFSLRHKRAVTVDLNSDCHRLLHCESWSASAKSYNSRSARGPYSWTTTWYATNSAPSGPSWPSEHSGVSPGKAAGIAGHPHRNNHKLEPDAHGGGHDHSRKHSSNFLIADINSCCESDPKRYFAWGNSRV